MYGPPCIWIYKLSQWTCRGILCGLLKELHSGNVVWNSPVHRNLPITQTSSHLPQAGVCSRGCSLEDVQDWSLVLLSVSLAFTGHRDSNSPFVPLSEIQILLRLFFSPWACRKQVGLVVFSPCLHSVLGDLVLSNFRFAAQVSCVKALAIL